MKIIINSIMIILLIFSFLPNAEKDEYPRKAREHSIIKNNPISKKDNIEFFLEFEEEPLIVEIEEEIQLNKIEVSKSEKDLLARIVYAEARGEPYNGKVAVAEVVLNRVEHEDFPDTIYDVIYQQGQFQPVSNGAINNTPDEESIKAVKEALNKTNLTNGSLFFYNSKTATDRWLDSRPTTVVIGNHTFKR
jgi:spore germination cell wall hydrolase CwlJ-like protein